MDTALNLCSSLSQTFKSSSSSLSSSSLPRAVADSKLKDDTKSTKSACESTGSNANKRSRRDRCETSRISSVSRVSKSNTNKISQVNENAHALPRTDKTTQAHKNELLIDDEDKHIEAEKSELNEVDDHEKPTGFRSIWLKDFSYFNKRPAVDVANAKKGNAKEDKDDELEDESESELSWMEESPKIKLELADIVVDEQGRLSEPKLDPIADARFNAGEVEPNEFLDGDSENDFLGSLGEASSFSRDDDFEDRTVIHISQSTDKDTELNVEVRTQLSNCKTVPEPITEKEKKPLKEVRFQEGLLTFAISHESLPIDFKYAVPTEEKIKAYHRKMHLYNEETNEPYRLWHSTFGRPVADADELFMKFDPFKEGIRSDFAGLGPGVNSYFYFLKIYGWLFLAFGLLSVPALIFNALASNRLAGSLAVLSVGNLFVDTIEFNETKDYYFCDHGNGCRAGHSVVLGYNVFYDFVVIISFIAVTDFAIFEFKNDQKRWNRDNPNLENFTLQITRLPPKIKYEAIKAHFETVIETIIKPKLIKLKKDGNVDLDLELGNVLDVQVVSATKDQLAMSIEHAKLSKQLDRLEATYSLAKEQFERHSISLVRLKLIAMQYTKAFDKLDGFWSTERALRVKNQDPKAIKAFVTFTTTKARDEIYKLYNKRIRWSSIKSLCKKVDKDLLLQGYKINVQSAASPTVIKWEHVEYTICQKRVRAFCALIVVVTILIVSAVIMFVSGTVEESGVIGVLSPDQHDYLESLDCPTNTSDYEDNGNNTYFEDICEGDVDVYDEMELDCLEALYCYCSYKFKTLDASVISPKNICYPFALDGAISFSFSSGNAVFVNLVNIFLEMVIVGSVSFEKHDDRVQEEKKLFTRIFFATFINTAVVKVLQNLDMETLLNFRMPVIGTGDYTDFNAAWYEDVGYDLTLIAVGNILGPHIFLFGIYSYKLSKRRLLKPISEQDIEEFYLGSEFVLAMRFAQIVVTIFVCLTYSAGIPFLYFVAAASCLITFWVDKFMLLRFHRRPVNYSNDIVIWICNMLIYGILLHLFLAILFFSDPEIFPFDESPFENIEENSLLEQLSNETATTAITISKNNFFLRITGAAVFPLTLLFLVLVIYRLLYQFEVFFFAVLSFRSQVAKLISRRLRQRERRRHCRNKISGAADEELVEELEELESLAFEADHKQFILDRSKLIGPKSYNILANPNYALNFKLKDNQSFSNLLQTNAEPHYSADVVNLLEKGDSAKKRMKIPYEISQLKQNRKANRIASRDQAKKGRATIAVPESDI